MKPLLNSLKVIFLFGLLTITTQVGGLAYLIYLIIATSFLKTIENHWQRSLSKIALFLVVYFLISFILVPPLAEAFGRQQLPLFSSEKNPIRPAKLIYFLANRNYVRPKLYEITNQIALDFNKKYPEARLMYLDGNFPFIDEFPLLPHLSHDDGRKLDLTYIYKNTKKNQFARKHPSWLGYGYAEDAKPGEYDYVKDCLKKGNWQYDYTSRFFPNRKKDHYQFDQEVNRQLLLMILQKQAIRRVFIEPHLKSRLKLNKFGKARAAGCHAVRHDDHIHIQL